MNRPLLGALTLAALVGTAAAQSPDVVVSIQRGTQRLPIARFAGGQWVGIADSANSASRPAPGVECLPTDALETVVVSGGPPAEAARLVTAEMAQEWKIVEPAIRQLFQRREREHRLTASNLASVPMTIDWVYATPQRQGTPPVYYFEASKRVPDPGTAPEEDPKGTLVVAVSGWLRADVSGGAALALGSKTELRWEQDQVAERAGGRRSELMPLGILRSGTQVVWVMKGQIGDIGWFTLYDIGASGVRTLGSGC